MKVNLELMPWLTTAVGYQKPGRLLLEEEMASEATIGDVLNRVAAREPLFSKVVFDGTGHVHGCISVVLNDRILGQIAALNVKLKDGDTIRLFPTVDGG
ncbi:MAG: MoaD/ThiS family protein [Chloroflexota bacterium]